MKMWGVTAAGVQGLLAEPRQSRWHLRVSTSLSRNRPIGAVHRHKRMLDINMTRRAHPNANMASQTATTWNQANGAKE